MSKFICPDCQGDVVRHVPKTKQCGDCKQTIGQLHIYWFCNKCETTFADFCPMFDTEYAPYMRLKEIR